MNIFWVLIGGLWFLMQIILVASACICFAMFEYAWMCLNVFERAWICNYVQLYSFIRLCVCAFVCFSLQFSISPNMLALCKAVSCCCNKCCRALNERLHAGLYGCVSHIFNESITYFAVKPACNALAVKGCEKKTQAVIFFYGSAIYFSHLKYSLAENAFKWLRTQTHTHTCMHIYLSTLNAFTAAHSIAY